MVLFPLLMSTGLPQFPNRTRESHSEILSTLALMVNISNTRDEKTTLQSLITHRTSSLRIRSHEPPTPHSCAYVYILYAIVRPSACCRDCSHAVAVSSVCLLCVCVCVSMVCWPKLPDQTSVFPSSPNDMYNIHIVVLYTMDRLTTLLNLT